MTRDRTVCRHSTLWLLPRVPCSFLVLRSRIAPPPNPIHCSQSTASLLRHTQALSPASLLGLAKPGTWEEPTQSLCRASFFMVAAAGSPLIPVQNGFQMPSLGFPDTGVLCRKPHLHSHSLKLPDPFEVHFLPRVRQAQGMWPGSSFQLSASVTECP